jgi:hypothetical protein
MTKLQELEQAITALPQGEYAALRQWFLQSDWEKWDLELQEDVHAGRLDFLIREAAEAKAQGNLRNL